MNDAERWSVSTLIHQEIRGWSTSGRQRTGVDGSLPVSAWTRLVRPA